MVAEFPFGLGRRQFLLKPSQLALAGNQGLVAVDGEKVGVAPSELVVKLGGGKVEVLVVKGVILLMVANGGHHRHPTEQFLAGTEQVVQPLPLVRPVIDHVTQVQQE